ncbi:Arylsulfatase [Crateriforma conspicua]|nr:Arylsulfatase [Crateriforma conspicua]
MRDRIVNRFLMIPLMVTLAVANGWADSPSPNIVVIMADDLGLGDVGFHARKFRNQEPIVETPNIDALAAQGLWFTDGHSATALCAPTRYSVMSGKNGYRSYAPWGVWSTFAPSAMIEGEATLGSVVQDAGYRTGFVGKWHLGGDFLVPGTDQIYRGPKNGDLTGKVDMSKMVGGGPRDMGFDYDFTVPCGIQGPIYTVYENQTWFPLGDDSEIIFFNEQTAKHPQDVSDKGPGLGDSNWDASQLGKLVSQKASNFIRSSAAKDQPFFLYFCTHAVHLPHRPPVEFDGKPIKGTTPSNHLDMVAELDMQTKRIVDALKSTKTYDNTLIVLMSDNGGLQDGKAAKHGYAPGGGWNGSKNSPLEGGHRVPFIAVWPSQIEAGVCDELVVNQDLVATLAALVGTEIPVGQAPDSNNFLPLLTGEGEFQSRPYFIQQAGSRNEVMLRKMPWKLIIQSNQKRTAFEPKALFNLMDDPTESRDLAKQPEYQATVAELLADYQQIVESRLPTAPSRQASVVKP